MGRQSPVLWRLAASQGLHAGPASHSALDLCALQVSKSVCILTTQAVMRLLKSKEAAAAVDVRTWPTILDTGACPLVRAGPVLPLLGGRTCQRAAAGGVGVRWASSIRGPAAAAGTLLAASQPGLCAGGTESRCRRPGACDHHVTLGPLPLVPAQWLPLWGTGLRCAHVLTDTTAGPCHWSVLPHPMKCCGTIGRAESARPGPIGSTWAECVPHLDTPNEQHPTGSFGDLKLWPRGCQPASRRVLLSCVTWWASVLVLPRWGSGTCCLAPA